MKKLTTKSLVSAVAALFMGTLIMSGCGGDEGEANPGGTNDPPATDPPATDPPAEDPKDKDGS